MRNILESWFSSYDGDSERFQLLQSIPLFQGLTDNQYHIVSDLMYERNYHPGETIFSLGDPSSALFIIEEGAVEIQIGEDNAQNEILAELTSGDFFGERGLCKDLNRTATARATEDTTLLVIFRPELMDVISREKDFGVKFLMNLMEVLGDRLETANERIKKLLSEQDINGE